MSYDVAKPERDNSKHRLNVCKFNNTFDQGTHVPSKIMKKR